MSISFGAHLLLLQVAHWMSILPLKCSRHCSEGQTTTLGEALSMAQNAEVLDVGLEAGDFQ